MRLDKFLKNSRIIKRRTVAKAACDTGKVSVNGRPAKAGTDVKTGDEIKITYGTGELTVRVLELKENVRTENAETMYEVIQ